MSKYYVKHKVDELYVHFNPIDQTYVVMDKLLGSATFTKVGGNGFIREANLIDNWELVLISTNIVTKKHLKVMRKVYIIVLISKDKYINTKNRSVSNMINLLKLTHS